MTSELTLFHFEENKESFESHSHENGYTHWWATDLMKMLNYENWNTFSSKVISKAMTTCTTLGIPMIEMFEQKQRIVDGKTIIDFKLSREACYLIAMNGDNKKPEVARAQFYFTKLAGAVVDYLEEAAKVERINMRTDVSERESSLSGIVHKREIENYGFFQNAGYRGMYNKNMSELKKLRNVPAKGKSLLDYMGKDELAANLFRITQTELKIKTDDIRGQNKLQDTAYIVGAQVRKSMIEISGVKPENMPAMEHIDNAKKTIKGHTRDLKKIDKKDKPKRKKGDQYNA
jgi:DNA-damage-inducible protein D